MEISVKGTNILIKDSQSGVIFSFYVFLKNLKEEIKFSCKSVSAIERDVSALTLTCGRTKHELKFDNKQPAMSTAAIIARGSRYQQWTDR